MKVNMLYGESVLLRSSIFGIFSLTHKEKEVCPDDTHPMLFEESSCVCMQSFRPVAPFIFLAKIPFLDFF